jgi:hypothetical protein
MSDAQVALAQWVQVAVQWQIQSESDADLAAAEQQFHEAMAKAKADVAAIAHS